MGVSAGLLRVKSALLNDGEAVAASNYILAKRCGVHYQTVERARRELEARGIIAAVTLRRCADGIERNVALIGKRAGALPNNRRVAKAPTGKAKVKRGVHSVSRLSRVEIARPGRTD